MIIAIFMALTNVRAGRVDARGAFRFLLVCLTLRMIGFILTANHVADDESVLYRMGLAQGLLQTMTAWLLYLALEPHVRRRWPQTLISWSRALAGRLQDPLVARDLAVGTALAVLWFAFAVVLLWGTGTLSSGKQLDTLLDVRHIVGFLLLEIEGALELSVLFCFNILLLRVVLRREWAVVLAVIIISGLSNYFLDPVGGTFAVRGVGLIAGSVLGALLVVALIRFGLIAVAAFWAVQRFVSLFPTTLEFSTWYVGVALFTLGAVALFAAYACYMAVGTKRWADAIG